MRYVIAGLATLGLLAVWRHFWSAFSDPGDLIMIALVFATPALIVRSGKRGVTAGRS